jgi:hypothetical protein
MDQSRLQYIKQAGLKKEFKTPMVELGAVVTQILAQNPETLLGNRKVP